MRRDKKARRLILTRLTGSTLLAASAAVCLLDRPADAQSYSVLQAFGTSNHQSPNALVQGTDGNFYGTTQRGGAGYGSVFSLTPGGAQTTLYSFSGIDGATPFAGLVQGRDGDLYGTTSQGGAGGLGTVFRMTPTGALTTLYSFSGTDGANPYAGLVQGTDGSFYGTTYQGGAGDCGTAFRITPSGALTTLHSFLAYVNGQYPAGGLVQGADGNFYGTTEQAGSGFGTVFKMTPDGALTTLHSFNWDPDGAYPEAGLVQGADGSFYGTTSYAGYHGVGAGCPCGTVFKITPSGTFATIHWFGFSDGSEPLSGLVQGTDGNFYGTTSGGGGAAGYGTLFKITPAGVLTTLHSFAFGDGSIPQDNLVQGTDGNFYGTTSSGGPGTYGTVFTITSAGALTTLYAFGDTKPSFPRAGLVKGSDGRLYGTTYLGGAGGYGTAFGLTPSGTLTTLHSFDDVDGEWPYSGLVQGADGDFYGTTNIGGTSQRGMGFGTVFKMTPAGALTTLHAFSGADGEFPEAGLTQGADGNLYGTTYGGAVSWGTVFRITPDGALTTLYSFTGGDGSGPMAGLVQGTDGNFYGTTKYGAAPGKGTVFTISPAGALTTLHSFAGADGQYPEAGLVQGADGNFYGTTSVGGANNLGTVFSMTPAGTLTTLYPFAGIDGSNPQASLVQATDGNFYGTTYSGGTADYGTLFSVTAAGVLTTLYSFEGSDGIEPQGSLTQGTDGSFYGTTFRGGPLGGGVVFRLTLGPGPSPTVTGVSPAGGPVSGGTVVTVSGTDFQPGATVSFGGTPAAGVTYFSATTIYALTPNHVAGPVTVAVTNPDLQAGSLASAFTYLCSWIPTALNEGPYCEGGTISLWAQAVPGGTYSWTGPNGFTSQVQNPTISNVLVANSGSYAVTVTVSGCSSSPGTTNVVVNPLPAVPFVTAPSIVGAGSPNRTASVPAHAGSTYSWTIGNGTITGGQGTSQITFTAGTAGTPLTLSVTETNASGCLSAPGSAAITVEPFGSAAIFYTLPPCRVIDTRTQTGPLGAPSLQPGATRMFDMSTNPCGIPAGAAAISANVTVTNVRSSGELVVFPADATRPDTSTLSFTTGRTRANNAIVFFASTGEAFSIFDDSTGTVDLVLDVNGYFQ